MMMIWNNLRMKHIISALINLIIDINRIIIVIIGNSTRYDPRIVVAQTLKTMAIFWNHSAPILSSTMDELQTVRMDFQSRLVSSRTGTRIPSFRLFFVSNSWFHFCSHEIIFKFHSQSTLKIVIFFVCFCLTFKLLIKVSKKQLLFTDKSWQNITTTTGDNDNFDFGYRFRNESFKLGRTESRAISVQNKMKTKSLSLSSLSLPECIIE